MAIDAAVYFFLVHAGWLDPAWSKRVSFAVGALWAFIANKLFTFQSAGFVVREPLLFSLVYLAGWFLNSVTHDFVFSVTPSTPLAFLVATGLSTITNFLGQKWIVFRAQPKPRT